MVESTASFDVDVLQGLVPGPFGWIRDGKFFYRRMDGFGAYIFNGKDSRLKQGYGTVPSNLRN